MGIKRAARLAALSAAFAISIIAPARPARADGPTLEECVAANEAAEPLIHARLLREAHVKLRSCAVSSCPAVVRDDCFSGAAKVDAIVPTIIFTARDSSGNDVAGVTVKVDGETFADHLDGAPLEIDPGEHNVTFEIPGQAPVTKHFVFAEGEKNRRERIDFGSPAPPSNPPDSAPPPTVEDPGSGRKTLAFVVGGIGAAGIVVGTITGILASNSWSNAKKDCGPTFPSSCLSPTNAQADRNSASSSATISTVAFVAGGALLAGGVVLYLTAPSADKTRHGFVRIAPAVAGTSRGLVLEGTFQ